jgi:hypothetical protein
MKDARKGRKNYTMRKIIICARYLILRIKDDTLGGECSTYQRNDKCTQNFAEKSEGNILFGI